MEHEDEKYDPIKADTPRIDDLSMISGVARLNLGNRVFVVDQKELEDGRVIAYLGISKAKNTSAGTRGRREISFVNYAPVGAAIAEPTDDNEWIVHLPDIDAVNDAATVRMEIENEHRANHTPPIRNFILDRAELYDEQLDEYDFDGVTNAVDELTPIEMYHLGRIVGMRQLAIQTRDELFRRLEAPYSGEKRWSPESDK